MSYPIQWLDATFRTRQNTEQLLRPDLDSGLITEHDFHLASTFLPGNHRYWPNAFGLLTSGAVAGYGVFSKRSRWTVRRTTILGVVAGVCGTVYGQFRRAKAHWTFTQQLDDPVAFTQALENVNQRTGGVKPLAWTLQRAVDAAQKQDMHGNILRPQESSFTPDVDQSVSPDTTSAEIARPPSSSSEDSSRPANRWDQIRAANARNAGQPSSWDILRQQHERERVVKKTVSEDRFDDVDLAEEQARFDAMVDAERRKASR
ncbi:hypothetical protein B0H21DRAFT_819296 [Amylocystis lapponica]|nr:hypothetical protein B0H21DRAFT_819296 [Amylocystis lapponica]